MPVGTPKKSVNLLLGKVLEKKVLTWLEGVIHSSLAPANAFDVIQWMVENFGETEVIDIVKAAEDYPSLYKSGEVGMIQMSKIVKHYSIRSLSQDHVIKMVSNNRPRSHHRAGLLAKIQMKEGNPLPSPDDYMAEIKASVIKRYPQLQPGDQTQELLVDCITAHLIEIDVLTMLSRECLNVWIKDELKLAKILQVPMSTLIDHLIENAPPISRVSLVSQTPILPVADTNPVTKEKIVTMMVMTHGTAEQVDELITLMAENKIKDVQSTDLLVTSMSGLLSRKDDGVLTMKAIRTLESKFPGLPLFSTTCRMFHARNLIPGTNEALIYLLDNVPNWGCELITIKNPTLVKRFGDIIVDHMVARNKIEHPRCLDLNPMFLNILHCTLSTCDTRLLCHILSYESSIKAKRKQSLTFCQGYNGILLHLFGLHQMMQERITIEHAKSLSIQSIKLYQWFQSEEGQASCKTVLTHVSRFNVEVLAYVLKYDNKECVFDEYTFALMPCQMIPLVKETYPDRWESISRDQIRLYSLDFLRRLVQVDPSVMDWIKSNIKSLSVTLRRRPDLLLWLSNQGVGMIDELEVIIQKHGDPTGVLGMIVKKQQQSLHVVHPNMITACDITGMAIQ
ncbi:hypothetical protein SAMD00019534_038230 [Acytostelium subglobosum LB1]|uniref:hypothetical protein n=1 Tax=Acytostelium subglobosum LB1 TaxID=1410327 RepID=UPI000644C5A3|nr:hypothetical protein SAMD00019534_038230 [Acytostelium subglobosum LB1]GAM20648.1 hypothetical protein SAMD00019534_038230 [Acytostelium subglobosum LB1]|eukprot:XP_012760169.1 hypothetical protein SAMD00019534_038230 [Acytostelium subglobosum LB1]